MIVQPEACASSLALLTDLYQLTMAYGYWKNGMADHEAVFHLTFRKQPFGGGYSIAAGLETAIAYLRNFKFAASDLEYLASLTGNNGRPLFDPAFLEYLAQLRFDCDVDAIPEGTVVFPNEPLLRVRGSLIQGQLIETALLNIINFQTLITTKAARVCHAAQGDPVLEFGLRRAQGIDGALTASRAAYIGGCAGTSNVLAGKRYGIPVKGTHAHSWVMCFPSEPEAFDAYAQAMPNNCVFLVDTFDTIEGVGHAIDTAKRLRVDGHEMVGIRLDSGDLAYLSIEARRLLDEAGFPDAAIVASNDLDEYLIESLKQQGACINVWGVGTKLVTAYDQPALGGVYKLAAIRSPGGDWEYKVKLSEQAIKISTPGILQVRRFYNENGYIADGIYHEGHQLECQGWILVDPKDATRRKHLGAGTSWVDLLEPIFRKGEFVGSEPTLDEIRERVRNQLTMLHSGIKRFLNPHEYPVGFEKSLHDMKTNLVLQARGELVS